LGTSVNPTSIIDLTYSYGTTNNNGNVLSTTYAGGGLSYTQSFGYDSLNRLTTSNENSGASWSQTNGYDRYGNRWIDLGGGNQSLYFNTSNNRISGWSYDASGDLLNDGAHAYTYDAEGKIKTVDATTAYTYDGEGHRVKKLVGENTRFIYGISGQLVAEFDGSSGNLKKEYLYGATLITIEPTAVNSNATQYTTSDNLGSPRVITNSSAAVVSRYDYMPFGEELAAGTGGRTTGMGFSNSGDSNRKKFTGYERDAETGLDFAQARYYSNIQARFISPDPLMSSGEVADPQSWNRYSYCFNNPIIYSDPTGMEVPKGPVDSQFAAGFRGAGSGELEVFEGTQYTQGEVAKTQSASQPTLSQRLRSRWVASQVSAAQALYNPFAPPSPTGTQVPGSATPTYNCMAWALGRRDRWIQPGQDGRRGAIYEIDRSVRPNVVTASREGDFTPSMIPAEYGGRILASGQDCPPGTYQMRVFEDSANPANWHAERRESNGTWSSKNGDGPKYFNISSPNEFYRRYYPPRGSLITFDYCVPIRPRRL
jgi:RHS repeat-associated protein